MSVGDKIEINGEEWLVAEKRGMGKRVSFMLWNLKTKKRMICCQVGK